MRQAGSYVGPDKLRFDFTHGSELSDEDVRDGRGPGQRVDRRQRPRARRSTTTLDEAKALGAMALFGEKYGDVVRMVEIGDGSWSRELCGGTHVRSTAEIGLFKITSEGSSAANVRRIEAITGPEAVAHCARARRAAARGRAARCARSPSACRRRSASCSGGRSRRRRRPAAAGVDVDGLAARGEALDGARVVIEAVDGADVKALVDVADRVKGRLGDEAVVVLGSAADERVHLVAAVTPGARRRAA